MNSSVVRIGCLLVFVLISSGAKFHDFVTTAVQNEFMDTGHVVASEDLSSEVNNPLAETYDESTRESGEMPSFFSGLFDASDLQVSEWEVAGQRLTAIGTLDEYQRPVWISAVRDTSGEWTLDEAAVLGEYIFFTEDFKADPSLQAVQHYFSEIVENPYLTKVYVPLQSLKQAAELDQWMRTISGALMFERNGLVFHAGEVNDPDYFNSWELAKLELEPVWRYFGFEPHLALGRRVVIAIVDNGAPQSADFANWVNLGEIADNGLDDDNNDFVDDINGWNFFSNSNDLSYAGGHGGTVTRIAASIAGNGFRTASPATSAALMRVLHSESSASTHFTAISAMVYAVNHADVVNCSFVSTSSTMMDYAVRIGTENNVMVIAAAGNNKRDLATLSLYPAKVRQPNLICVGASNVSEGRANTNYSAEWVHLFAPAGATSFSTPLVTSTVALLKAIKPDATVEELRSALLLGVDPFPALISVSGGRLNVKKAVEALVGFSLDELPGEPQPPSAPILETPEVGNSDVVFPVAVVDAESSIEVEISRNGSEFVAISAGFSISDGSVRFDNLLEGATYVFRFRTVKGELYSDWTVSDPIQTAVYVERDVRLKRPLNFYDFNSADSDRIADRGKAAMHLDATASAWSAGLGTGYALALGGDHGGMQITPAQLISSDPIRQRTISLWIKLDPQMATRTSVIFEQGNALRGLNLIADRGFLLANGWNRVNGESGWKGTTIEGGKLLTGDWNHVALVLHAGAVMQDNGLRLYLNGVLVGSGNASQLFADHGEMGIGQVIGSTYYRGRSVMKMDAFQGAVDDFGIWDYALSSTEVELIILQSGN